MIKLTCRIIWGGVKGENWDCFHHHFNFFNTRCSIQAIYFVLHHFDVLCFTRNICISSGLSNLLAKKCVLYLIFLKISPYVHSYSPFFLWILYLFVPSVFLSLAALPGVFFILLIFSKNFAFIDRHYYFAVNVVSILLVFWICSIALFPNPWLDQHFYFIFLPFLFSNNCI